MPAQPSTAEQIYGYHYEEYHIKSGDVVNDGFSREDVTGMKSKVKGFAFRVTPLMKHDPKAAAEVKTAKARATELESVLDSVAQQFRRFGERFPDGFDSRVFRWVEDAIAGRPLKRLRAAKSAAKAA